MLPDGPITFQFLTSQFLLLKSTKIECFIFHEGFVIISILVHRSAAIISIVICMLRLFTQATHPFSMACLLFVYVCSFFPVQSWIALQANLQILIYIVHDTFRLLNLHVNFFSIETKIVITSKIIL